MDWESQAQALIKNLRKEAKGKTTFNDLENLVEDHGKEILKTVLQGVVRDKGDGKELPKPQGAKNKGVKKKI
jgi:hypothetical protein